MRKKFIIFLFLAILGAISGIIFISKNSPNLTYLKIENQSAKILTLQPINATSTEPVKIPIFVYHSIRPDTPNMMQAQLDYSITPEMFRRQLEYIKDNNFMPISLDDLVYYVNRGGYSSGTRPVVLTFDDGWKNQYDYAFPLLREFGYTANFYIFSNPIGKDSRFMTWEELGELKNAGMTIGSHSLSHPYLNKLTSEKLYKELEGSKKTLETHLNTSVNHFASPFGYSSSTTINALRKAGYKTGRTLTHGSTHTIEELLNLHAYLVTRNFNTLNGFWITPTDLSNMVILK